MKSPNLVPTRLLATMAASLSAMAVLMTGTKASAQSSVSGVFPNGAYLFQPTNTLAFTAASSAGITNVTVALTVSSLSGSTFIKNLSLGNGLTLSGPNTSETVTAVLKSNTVYAATIQVTDANGNTASTNIAYFDTIAPTYTWEAEDFDYNGGQFIDNPQFNGYAGLTGTPGTDCYHPGSAGNSSYRPNPLETETASDTPRLAYIGTTNVDFDVGYNNGGDWGNYTRHYPAGLYNVFVRGSGGNGPQTDAGEVIVTNGTAQFGGTGPYTYSVAGKGWQTYTWCPVTDSGGSLAQLTIPSDGTASTLQVLIDHGNCNQNFFMLVPANTNAAANATSITNISPDGSVQFQSASALTFSALSPNGIDPANITVIMNYTNLLGVGGTTNITTANGLVVGGVSTNRSVSVPLVANVNYSVFVQITDGSGNTQGFPLTFDTISPGYIFEAEDFDENSGQFIDNPQTNAYFGAAATQGIDDNVAANNVHSFAYRGGPLNGFGLNNETCGDKPRLPYINTNNISPLSGLPYVDYDVGYNSGGDWGNYTRHFPAGRYNIFMRGANGGINGGGNKGAGTASMSLVTAGFGTSTQTITNMGTFTIYASGGWQSYYWVPLKDSFGNLVVFDGGSQETLQVQTLGLASGGSYNANFYMLMPAVTNLPQISNLYPNGTGLFQNTNTLAFVATSGAAINTNNIVVKLNGVNATGLTFSAVSTGWAVSCPVQVNSSYTVNITVTDGNGQTASSSLSFDTFQASSYQFEAEDYDYTSNGVSGLFFDNPQTNAYYDLPSTAGIDNVQADSGANPFDYRNVDANGTLGASPATTPSADLPRAQFVNGKVDYNIGFFGPGSWCNYTRTYPAGTYNVWERYAEGGSQTASTLSMVTSGYGTASQTTSLLGTFVDALGGWSLWAWAPLTDTNGHMVTVTLTGSRTTLQLGGSPNTSDPEVNVNFLMLVPVATTIGPVDLTATRSGKIITLSFPTQGSTTYQVLYTSSLLGGSWTPLGSSVSGSGSVMSVTDTNSASARFYRLQITH